MPENWAVTQCRCDNCQRQPRHLRHWNVRRPEGSVWATTVTWVEAMLLARDLAGAPSPRSRLYPLGWAA